MPIGKFFSVTANDYYWNPERFNPDHSWRQATAQFMGPAAVPVVEAFYRLRGDDYYDFFAPVVNLADFKRILERMEKVSWDPGIPKYCWLLYNECVAIQKKAKGK